MNPVNDDVLSPSDIEGIKLIVYGDSGTGKTWFAGTANDDPRTSPVLWIDLEGGTRTIADRVRKLESLNDLGNPQPGFIDVVRIRTFGQLQKVYDFLYTSKYRDQRAVYKTVVIDSLTEINQLVLQQAMSDSPVKRLEIDVPEQRDYLKANSTMKAILRALRDIDGLHVILTALAQTIEDDATGAVRIKPALIGKLRDEAQAIVEYVGYLRINVTSKKREIIFQPEGRINAKERSHPKAQIGSLTDPSMTSLLDKIQKLQQSLKTS